MTDNIKIRIKIYNNLWPLYRSTCVNQSPVKKMYDAGTKFYYQHTLVGLQPEHSNYRCYNSPQWFYLHSLHTQSGTKTVK